jgi:hypothetical protein
VKALLGLVLLSAPLFAELGEHPQPAFYQIQDPVETALDWAADGQLGRAQGRLEKACQASPNDAEAWAALAVVYGELKLPAEVRRCERRVLALDRAQGKTVLKTRRASFAELKAEVRAQKEARGELALPVQRLQATPDTGAWARLEKEDGKAREWRKAHAEEEAALKTPRIKQRKK